MFSFISSETFGRLLDIPFVPSEQAQKDQDEWLWIEEDVFLEDMSCAAEENGFLWSYRPQQKLFSSDQKLGSCTQLWSYWYPRSFSLNDDIPF